MSLLASPRSHLCPLALTACGGCWAAPAGAVPYTRQCGPRCHLSAGCSFLRSYASLWWPCSRHSFTVPLMTVVHRCSHVTQGEGHLVELSEPLRPLQADLGHLNPPICEMPGLLCFGTSDRHFYSSILTPTCRKTEALSPPSALTDKDSFLSDPREVSAGFSAGGTCNSICRNAHHAWLPLRLSSHDSPGWFSRDSFLDRSPELPEALLQCSIFLVPLCPSSWNSKAFSLL